MTSGPVDLRNVRNWWSYVPGALWRHPEGPASNLGERDRHPVTHVARGVIVAQGGSGGGWSLYAHECRLKYCGDNEFIGDVNWVQIDVGTDDHDHLIPPEERLNLAMARP
jgi:hypothetical protein